MTKARTGGFTLLEVMIALALMAVVSVMAWRGLDSVTRTDSRLAQRDAARSRVMRALEQFDIDLALRATTELPPRAGTEPPLLLPAALQVRQQVGMPFFIEIVRSAPAAPGQWQRVQWWQRGGVLYRAAGAPRAAFPLPAPQASAQAVVLDGVASFRLRAWEPGRGWRNLPGVAPARAPASGLEAELNLRSDGEAASRRFRRVVVLEGLEPAD
jgi:general secretion pathway protein J